MSASSMDHHGQWEQMKEAREEADDLLRRVNLANLELQKIANDLNAHDARVVGIQASCGQLEQDIVTLRQNTERVAS